MLIFKAPLATLGIRGMASDCHDNESMVMLPLESDIGKFSELRVKQSTFQGRHLVSNLAYMSDLHENKQQTICIWILHRIPQ